jgi:predicted PurR-regulated permease PerM
MRVEKLASYAVIFIGLVLLAVVLKTFQSVMRPLAIALILVFLFTPLVRYSRRKNIPVWLTFSGLILAEIIVLGFVSSFITVENLNLENALPQIQERISEDSGGMLELGSKLGFGIENITPEKLSQFTTKVAQSGLSAITTIFSETFMALILLMFLIQGRPALFDWIEKRGGKEAVARLRSTLWKIESDILAHFSTKALMSLGTAICTGIVLLLFGAKFIFISVLIVFMMNFIPIIGSVVAVGIILISYALVFGFSMKVLWLLLAMMAVQGFFGNILEPNMVGKKLNMSPIIIVISLSIWGWIWGIVGMFLAVPLTILTMILIKHLVPEKKPVPNAPEKT